MIPIRNAVPSRYPPVVTWLLIATNCLIFLLQNSLSPAELEEFLRDFALIPARYTAALAYGEAELSPADLFPFFSMMFLHGGWLHLIFNMWTLWLFGPTVEDRLGHGRYLAFYLACGLAASIAHVFFNPTSIVPALGASGAIAGVLGCYMRLFPLARVVVVVPILFIPLFFEVYAFLFVGLWFLIQIFQGALELLLPSSGGGVAWWAHVGGFVAGLTLGPPWSGPSSVTAHTTQTKACSASILRGGYDVPLAIGGFHVDRRSLLAFLHILGDPADVAAADPRGHAGAQDRATRERTKIAGDPACAPARNHAAAGLSERTLHRHKRFRGWSARPPDDGRGRAARSRPAHA